MADLSCDLVARLTETGKAVNLYFVRDESGSFVYLAERRVEAVVVCKTLPGPHEVIECFIGQGHVNEWARQLLPWAEHTRVVFSSGDILHAPDKRPEDKQKVLLGLPLGRPFTVSELRDSFQRAGIDDLSDSGRYNWLRELVVSGHVAREKQGTYSLTEKGVKASHELRKKQRTSGSRKDQRSAKANAAPAEEPPVRKIRSNRRSADRR
jgi:DNA-binding PadR family transcriptional regulator